MIIFLNGSSSSGKSTIARQLMRQSERPLLYYSVDHFVDFWIDEKFVAFEDEAKEWFFQQHVRDPQSIIHAPIVEGPNIPQLHWDMIEAFTVLIKKGYDLIIDEVLWDPDIFNKFIDAFAQSDRVYLVCIACDLIECEKRESKRENRFKGLARKLYSDVYHALPEYDLVVDATHTSAEKCATRILNFVNEQPAPKAFFNYAFQAMHFERLNATHFPLLLPWLNGPDIIPWWNQAKLWSFAEIENRFDAVVQGYLDDGKQKKPLLGFVIFCAQTRIGYVQVYRLKDFPRSGYNIQGLSDSMATIDIFFAEPNYLLKGLAPLVIKQFLNQVVWKNFDSCFLDPTTDNTHAIHVLVKAGFKPTQQLTKPPVTWMVAQKG